MRRVLLLTQNPALIQWVEEVSQRWALGHRGIVVEWPYSWRGLAHYLRTHGSEGQFECVLVDVSLPNRRSARYRTLWPSHGIGIGTGELELVTLLTGRPAEQVRTELPLQRLLGVHVVLGPTQLRALRRLTRCEGGGELTLRTLAVNWRQINLSRLRGIGPACVQAVQELLLAQGLELGP